MELVTGPNEFTTSVERALTEIDPRWREYPGLIVAGSHAQDDFETKIEKIRNAREHRIPFLGICFGFELAVIESCRNMLGITNATSAEFGVQGTEVVVKLPSLRVGIMPVGDQFESHWHQYAVHPEFAVLLGKSGFETVLTGTILEYMVLNGHPHFVGTQFHPEYQSTIDKPHPVLVNLVTTAKHYRIV